MQVLHIFSAGAAQAVVARLAAALQHAGTHRIHAHYGAVQAMKARVLSGEPADVVILTDRLIDELIADGRVVPGSRVDLGPVATGIAVRGATPAPALGSPEQLKHAMLAAPRVVCPDPAVATAGQVLLKALASLGIIEQIRPRLAYAPSGYAAVAGLAEGDLGVMQVTEILAHDGVVLAGTLPGARPAVYSAGLVAHSTQPEPSRDFIHRLAGQREALRAAGFGLATD